MKANQTFPVYSNGVLAATLRVKRVYKIVHHQDIRTKWNLGMDINHEYNALINLDLRTIRIYGYVTDQKERQAVNEEGALIRTAYEVKTRFDRSFKVGDIVRTGSYNLIYTDPIENITAQSVRVAGGRRGKTAAMKLNDFIYQNWNLDLEAIARHNQEERYYL